MVWDVASQQPTHTIVSPHKHGIVAMALSPGDAQLVTLGAVTSEEEAQEVSGVTSSGWPHSKTQHTADHHPVDLYWHNVPGGLQKVIQVWGCLDASPAATLHTFATTCCHPAHSVMALSATLSPDVCLTPL